MDFLLGHDGVDWAAGACMVVMLWRLGLHKRDGFLWSAGAALAWVVFNARLVPMSAPGMIINAVVCIISIRSWFTWTASSGIAGGGRERGESGGAGTG